MAKAVTRSSVGPNRGRMVAPACFSSFSRESVGSPDSASNRPADARIAVSSLVITTSSGGEAGGVGIELRVVEGLRPMVFSSLADAASLGGSRGFDDELQLWKDGAVQLIRY